MSGDGVEQSAVRGQRPRQQKRSLLLGSIVAAIALIGGVSLAVILGAQLGNDSSVSSEPVPVSSADQLEASPQPLDGNGIAVRPDDLRNLQPQELRELTRISVESVSSGDLIDWGKYGQALEDNFNLQVNAGSTVEDGEYVLVNSLDVVKYVADKYGIPLASGYADSLQELQGLNAMHVNNFNTAYIQYLEGNPITVKTAFDLTDITLISEANGNFEIAYTMTHPDNFFSSGAVSSSNSRVVGSLGRGEDANRVITGSLRVKEVDGYLVIASNP